MGGRIEISSEEEVGTAISVYIELWAHKDSLENNEFDYSHDLSSFESGRNNKIESFDDETPLRQSTMDKTFVTNRSPFSKFSD
jgi:hypothetical protein